MIQKHTLLPLGYSYDALEPYIDARTMEIHHTKHHQAYVDKLNQALEKYVNLQGKSLQQLIRDLNTVPGPVQAAVRNNGGGHLNHSFFWSVLKKGTQFEGPIAQEIIKEFGSHEKFKEQFKQTALNHFGSGWAWLALNKDKLEIISTPNQDSPLTDGKIPLLTIDIWEHAYYLKYQNKRADYIDAFFNIINWGKVNENLKAALNEFKQGR